MAMANGRHRRERALDPVEAALVAIKSEGAFAVELARPSDDLDIEVEGVGRIRFPISVATVRALSAVARPAPFGRRDQTLRDLSVRDTSEIAKSRIKIDARAWRRTLDPALASIRGKLGLPDGDELVAVLDKMLIYAPGQFFAAHQDSERSDDMIGSLVVTLPSVSSGGSVIVHHHGEKKIFRGAKRGPRDLSLLAFYADCHHEVKPITSGTRVVLTYHLLRRAAASARRAAPPSAATAATIERLAKAVATYFSTAAAPEYGEAAPEQPDRLIYLLDHEYSEKSLAWTRLKNGDRLRVGALRQIAERLDCDCWLALADVHENWNCEDDDWDYRSRGRRYRDDDDDDDDDAGGDDYTLLDLNDTTVELRHWVANDGSAAPSIPVSPSSSEICFTKASVDRDPFKSEHEGYMGNYGNTVDRWYHRAAFVMWPRDREFVIRAKMSPAWAVNELAARIRAGALPAARESARSLLPFWARHAPAEEKAAFFPKLLQVALSLDDAELSHGLLAPFGPHRLSARASPHFAALAERHGLSWSQRVFTSWSERGHRHGQASTWLRALPELFETLRSRAPKHGRALAGWLLTREVNAFAQARVSSLDAPALWLEEDATGKHTETLMAFLEAAAVIEAVSTRERLVTSITKGETALPILATGALLESCRDGRSPAAVRALGLDALYRSAVDALERTLASPARAVDDWSIDVPIRCTCALCTTLAGFLRDRRRVEHSWPLAEERRRHIHGVIGRHALPVTHVTTRRGSPYSLVLTKQKALFVREAAVRGRQKNLLAWLKKHHDAFVSRADS